MADYFTSDHFKLLNKWKGQKRDESNPEQNRAYDDLKKAYEVTEAWANEVQARLFPTGKLKIRKRPTSQANVFQDYNWARIYPSQNSPDELAYTVGINSTDGFIVKIDTVQADTALRTRYEAIRGPFSNQSPIVAILPQNDGLAKSLSELVEWTVEAIHHFKLRYDEVTEKLQLSQPLDNEAVLKHFDGKSVFKEFRTSWSPETTDIFCRLARAVHAAGLDWWHMGNSIQVRFGRKNPGNERAVSVLGVIRGKRSRKITLNRELGEIPVLSRELLTEDLIGKIEDALVAVRDSLDKLYVLETVRPGLWPDELIDDPAEPGDDVEDESELANRTEVGRPFNRIYYGPPGTGKTYALQRLLLNDYTQHAANFSRAEWEVQIIAEEIAPLTWWEAVAASLYDIGGNAKVEQLLEHRFIKAVAAVKSGNKNVRPTLWGALQHHTVTDSKTVKVEQRSAPYIFEKSADSVWTFAGDWKEECANLIAIVDRLKQGSQDQSQPIRRYSFVTFHQSYGYEEFIEGLRPILEDSTERIGYEIRKGAFALLCEHARLDPSHQYAMVIDEINRGNISKIFGELITLIEIDKREGAKHSITVTLPYSGDSFSVPLNVDIIGAMNTADRSLALVDTALRRRFDFVPCMPDTRDSVDAPLHNLYVSAGDNKIDIRQLLVSINQRVEALYDRDHTIGHAYFTSLHEVPDGPDRFRALAYIFRNRILPLMEEYFFEDWQKIRLVLADNQKPEGARFVTVSEDQEGDLANLFGSDHGLDTFATKERFKLEDSAFDVPSAYLGIYTTLGS